MALASFAHGSNKKFDLDSSVGSDCGIVLEAFSMVDADIIGAWTQ